MRDRTPTRALENGALRYGVYAEDGSLLRYEYLALEDDPADPGTELSKATLLQDSTEVSLFGSAADRTIDEAFAGIAGQLKLIMSDVAAITLTVQDTTGKPIPEVLVQGILSENGTAVYTNASGVAAGYIGEGAQVIKVSGYADLVDYSETVTIVKGNTVTKTIKLTTRNFLEIKSSQNVKFSGAVSAVDVSVGSGGGGGRAHEGRFDYICNGGGGGHVAKKEGIPITANTLYPAIIGAGGIAVAGEPGKDGGKSSFLNVSAPGGKGGSAGLGKNTRAEGNGFGCYFEEQTGLSSYRVVNGTAGTETMFASINTTKPYGGGGGGVYDVSDEHDYALGGKPGGGRQSQTSSSLRAIDGLGGGGTGVHNNTSDGSGGSGAIAIRIHFKAA